MMSDELLVRIVLTVYTQDWPNKLPSHKQPSYNIDLLQHYAHYIDLTIFIYLDILFPNQMELHLLLDCNAKIMISVVIKYICSIHIGNK